MPGYDGTGPMGMGPMTGGGWGPCNRYGGGYGFGGFGRGRGFRRGPGRGFGRGRGFGGRAFPPAWGAWGGPAYDPYQAGSYAINPDKELRTLKEEARAVRNDLDAITKRIQELESRSAAS